MIFSRKSRSLGALIAVSSGIFAPGAVVAQATPDEQVEIIDAALMQAVKTIDGKRVAFDPRAVEFDERRFMRATWGQERSAAQVSPITQRRGLLENTLDAAPRSCTEAKAGLKPWCRFRDIDQLVAVSNPVVKGNMATVRVSVWTNPPARSVEHNISWVLTEFTLQRDGGTWLVRTHKVLGSEH